MSCTCSYTGRTLLAKQELPPEAERALREFASEFSSAIDPLREDVVAAIRAGDIDPSSTNSVRVGIERVAGNYTNDIQLVYREGTQRGAQAGRAFAANRHQLDVAFDVVPERVLEEFADWSDEIVENEVLETITEDSIRYIRNAQEEGLSIDDLAQQVNDELFDGRLQDHVAERNARTATISSSNAGSHSAYEDADSVVAEEWLTSIDGRERDDHNAADGQIVAVGNTFLVGGEELRHPADPQGSQGNIINCRCTTVPVFRDQLSDDEFARLESNGRLNAAAPTRAVA